MKASINDTVVLRQCNLCGSEALTDVYPVSAVRACTQCGYVFRSPRPTSDAIAKFYSQAGKYQHWFDDMEGRELCWRQRLRTLLRFVSSGRVLDVGAGIGEFLHFASSYFDVVGTEVSSEAVRLAEKHFSVTLKREELELVVSRSVEKFDAISLIHVLEHVVDPAATLAHCRNLMLPGAWLYLAVPNDSALGWYKSNHGWNAASARLFQHEIDSIGYGDSPPFGSIDLRYAPPTEEIHLSHFSPSSLRSWLNRSGFQVIEIGPDPCYLTTGKMRLYDDSELNLASELYATSGYLLYQTMYILARRV